MLPGTGEFFNKSGSSTVFSNTSGSPFQNKQAEAALETTEAANSGENRAETSTLAILDAGIVNVSEEGNKIRAESLPDVSAGNFDAGKNAGKKRIMFER